MEAAPFLHRMSPLTERPLSDEHAVELEGLLHALADRQRLRIVSLLLHAGGRALCVGDLRDALGLSQPTVSHHLKRLVRAGLLVRERDGTFARFRVAPEALSHLRRVFADVPALA